MPAKYLVSIFILSVYFSSCDAPHVNPLDPLTPSSAAGVIEGHVQTFSLPYTGIEDVAVYWPNDKILVKSDSRGKFNLENVSLEDGYLIFSKQGFIHDSVYISWNNSTNAAVQINLNEIPVLDSLSLFTTVINQYGSVSQHYELNVRCAVTDKDKDIDSVYIRNNFLGFVKNLDYNAPGKIYQAVISPDEMNITDLEETIGFNFDIIIKDIFGRYFNIGSGQITRVIKNSAIIQHPTIDDDPVDSIPLFQWQRYKPGFDFYHKLEIYSYDIASSQLLYREDHIPPDSINYTSKYVFKPGNYYWVIWVVDNYNNRSRSFPATFIVE